MKKQTPHSYFEMIQDQVEWQAVLLKLGIKFTNKKPGRFLFAICPFHNEKTPSMRFVCDGLFFGKCHCFGCGYSYDIFDFVCEFLFQKNKVRTYHWFKKNFNIPLPWEKQENPREP